MDICSDWIQHSPLKVECMDSIFEGLIAYEIFVLVEPKDESQEALVKDWRTRLRKTVCYGSPHNLGVQEIRDSVDKHLREFAKSEFSDLAIDYLASDNKPPIMDPGSLTVELVISQGELSGILVAEQVDIFERIEK